MLGINFTGNNVGRKKKNVIDVIIVIIVVILRTDRHVSLNGTELSVCH